MTVCVDYKDSVRLIAPGVSGYGSEYISTEATIPAIFGQGTGWAHGNNQTAVTSDAFCYIDPNNAFVVSNFYRLEGMLIVAQLFGVAASDAWYRIVHVAIGRDSLLCNKIDNVLLSLKKTTEITGNIS